jgi:hypothetical protein
MATVTMTAKNGIGFRYVMALLILRLNINSKRFFLSFFVPGRAMLVAPASSSNS